MSSGVEVNIVVLQLDHLLAQIRDETLKLSVKGKTPRVTDPADRAYFDKLEGWKNKLDGLRQRLNQMLNSVESQRGFFGAKRSAPELRRSLAYRTEQSLDDQTANIERARDHAGNVINALEALLQRSLTPNDADVQSMVFDLANKPLEFFEKLHALEIRIHQAERLHALDAPGANKLMTVVQQARTQHLASARASSPAPDYFAAATLMLTLLRIWWLERLRNSPR